jgi:CBS domain containing-hemolysin-like protein
VTATLLASGGPAVAFDGPIGGALGVIALLLGVTFFFSGTETAFFSLQEIDRRRIAEGRTLTQRWIHGLLRRRAGLIATILIGNEFANVTISALTAGIVASLAPGKPWLTIVVLTPLLVLFAEITPKVLAFRFNRTWVDFAALPLWIVFWALLPLRLVVVAVVTALARLFGVTEGAFDRPIREEEFLLLVGRGTEQGVVAEDERDIIEAVFELDDLPVQRLMTPVPDIFSLPLDVGWDELLEACRTANFSRVPIWEGSPDEIVGVLLVKDLLRHRRKPLRSSDELRRLLLAPVFVPATKPANEMMKEMIRRRIHMAFVVDEHGTLMGLVSLDDLIIELVGELGEEDETEAEDIVTGDRELTVRAAVDLEDFTEETGIQVPEGDYHTLGGFVFHTLGRIPEEGDVVHADGHVIEVVEMDGRRVTLVRVRPRDDTPGEVTA